VRSEPPPRILSLLFAALLPRPARAEMLGDFVERYAQIAQSEGRRSARRWAWRQLVSLRPIALRREASAAQRAGRGTSTGRTGIVGDGWREGWLSGTRQALRAIRTRPGASLTVIATVALAIGATTAVFSVVRSVLLNPLPYPDSDRLVRVFQTKAGWLDSPNSQLRAFALRFPIAVPTFNDWIREDTGFEALGAFSDESFVLQGVDGAEIVSGQVVTSGVFDVLRVPARLGRTLTDKNDAQGAPRVVVLAHGLWQQRLGGRDDVLGETLTLEGTAHTIVGVMPPRFQTPDAEARLWTPLWDEQKADGRGTQYLDVIGRLADATSLELAAERMATIEEQLALKYPDTQGDIGSRLEGLLDSIVGDVRSTIWFLFGSVGLVLLIASVNITNMLAVMGLSRQRELAVKAALGAGAGRLVRGLLAESAVLAGLGGLAGLLVAYASMPFLLRFVPPSVPRYEQIGMDSTVILFALGITAVTALVGILPAVQPARVQPQDMIRAATRGTAGDRGGPPSSSPTRDGGRARLRATRGSGLTRFQLHSPLANRPRLRDGRTDRDERIPRSTGLS